MILLLIHHTLKVSVFLLEAMSFGILVIARENEGLKQYANNENIIIYFDKKELINILKNIIKDKRQFVELIKNGKKNY